MGLLTFIKDAGEKLFGKREAKAASAPAAAAPDPAAANKAAADAILAYIKTQDLTTIGITVTFDAASGISMSRSGSTSRRSSRWRWKAP